MNFSKDLRDKIRKKTATIGVIGMGYVGLPLAILIAKKGFKLFCFDKDSKRAGLLKKKISYFRHIPNSDLKFFDKKTNIYTGLKNTNQCDIIIVCLPTPLKLNNDPDLSHIKDTIKILKKNFKKGQLIILESTSYPGTTREEICNKIKNKFKIGVNFFVTFSSERINPGMNERNIHSIPKVISGYSKNCLKNIHFFYNKIFKKLIQTDSLEIAEFSKLLENIYRSVNIGFINEMKFIADKFNLDIFDILSVSETKPYGFKRFDPGPGIGGHCIPIDPQYLYWKSKRKGIIPKFIKLSADINLRVIKFILDKIHKRMIYTQKTKNNFKILVLGIAYKKNLDDDRESASIKLIQHLIVNNFRKIEYSDPFIKKYDFKKNIKKRSFEFDNKNLNNFDLVLLATDHDKFDYKIIKKYSKFIIDCRGRFKISSRIVRG